MRENTHIHDQSFAMHSIGTSIKNSYISRDAVDQYSSPPCTIGICCFSAKHTSLRRKSKDRFARNQDKVSE